MRRYFILFGLIFLALVAKSQVDVPRLRNFVPISQSGDSLFPVRLLEKSKMLVLFRRYTSLRSNMDYIVIRVNQNDSLEEFSFKLRSRYDSVFPLDISRDSLLAIWDVFLRNGLFAMKDEKDLPDSCAYQITDNYLYEFKLITRSKYKLLRYRSPELVVAKCNGPIERWNIIRCASAIMRRTE